MISIRWPRAARDVLLVTVSAMLFASVSAMAQQQKSESTQAQAAGDGTQPSNAGGASTDTTASELAPIVVDAESKAEPAQIERSFETSEDLAGFGETISTEPAWRSFQSTAELLGESVGAQLHRRGGLDDFATLSIRGAPSGQVKVLLDGISLGRASTSVINLADLPLDIVDRIEVYRGFSPVGLTPSSAAGVVNVITKDPKQATASAAAGGGSFGTAKVNAGGAGPIAGGNAAAFGSYLTTDGDFDYVSDNGTQNNPNDDCTLKLKNNDSDAAQSLVRWRRDLDHSTNLQIRNYVFYKNEGVPRFELCPDPHRPPPPPQKATLETTREIAAIALGGDDRHWSAEQNVTWEREKLSDFPGFDNTGETTASTTAGRWSRPLGKANWLSGSAEYTWEGFDQNAEFSDSDQQATRSSLAIAAGDDWTLDALHTTLSFQLRQQDLWNHDETTDVHTDDHSTDPRVGLRWNPFAGFVIKGNASSYFRPPTFDELYGTTGFTVGNPKLKPESGTAWDAGFEWTFERDPLGTFQLGYAWFGSNIDDVILVTLDFDRRARASNLQKATVRGHEARLEWKGPAGFAVSANYTYQNAENRSGDEIGADLPGLPSNEAWARLSWTHDRLVLAYDVNIVGAHYTDLANDNAKLPTRTEHNLTVAYGPFWKGFHVTLQAENLGNSLVPDEVGYPLPGRTFYATLSWSLEPSDAKRDAS